MANMVLAGVDVSAATFDVALLASGRSTSDSRQFDNTVDGRRQFLRWLQQKQGRGKSRVCLESTGVYSLDLSMMLHLAEDVEVMVVNPRVMSSFRDAARVRNKTDRADASLALCYLQSMEFIAWRAPSPPCWRLREMARRIHDLVIARVQEYNRHHAAKAMEEQSDWLVTDIEGHIRQLDERIEALRQSAQSLIKQHEELSWRYQLLLTVKGIGKVSAIQVLGELAVLPEGMKAKQWVSWAGLDPIHHQSGTSVHQPARISRRGNNHLRRALFMPAITAVRWEPHFQLFFNQLRDRGLKKKQAYTAVMRKLLHAIFGMFKHRTAFDGTKVREMPATETPVARPESSLLPIAGNPDEELVALQAGEAAEGLAWKASSSSRRMAAKGRRRSGSQARRNRHRT